MNKKTLGKVIDIEKEDIIKYFERGLALKELSMAIEVDKYSFLLKGEKEKICEKIQSDLKVTEYLYNKWWDDMVTKYGWVSPERECYYWKIDFKTNEVYIIYNDCL